MESPELMLSSIHESHLTLYQMMFAVPFVEGELTMHVTMFHGKAE